MKILKAPAKVNIGLWIIGKRADNYHNIYSYVQKISLYDKISVKPAPILKVKTTNPEVPENEGNIVYKAVKAFENYTGLEANFEIVIEKNIPVGAGLGGGSSDAAAILKFLNEEFGNPLTQEELLKIASYVGSDVPLFFKEGLTKIRGKGDIVEETGQSLEGKELFIVYPNVGTSTEEVYKKVSYEMLTKEEELSKIDSLLEDIDKFLNSVENTLGKLAADVYPQINEVLNTLEFLGYKGYITGSGSAVFVIGKPSEKLETICKVRNWKLIQAKFI